MDNRRKLSTQSATLTGNSWVEKTYPNLPRFPKSKSHRGVYIDEQEAKYPHEKSSEETIGDIEESGTNKNNYPPYPKDSVYANLLPKHQRCGYSELNTPETLTMMQKLRKLKELQMKRDITERYYTREIKRLIGEYYFGQKNGNMYQQTMKPAGRLQNSSLASGLGENSLEPCGTMTTIMRLECGCIQETTRPIFTTARGHVQRKNCNQSQDEILLKMTPSNPQEHLYSSLEQRKDIHRVKLKKRPPIEQRMSAKIPPGGDQGFETEIEKRNDEHDAGIRGNVSRTTSPCRKISDTSVNSG